VCCFIFKKMFCMFICFLFLHCCYYSSYIVVDVLVALVLSFFSCAPTLLLCGVIVFIALVFLLHWCYCFSRVVLLFFLHCDVIIVALMLLFSLCWCCCSSRVGAYVFFSPTFYVIIFVLVLLFFLVL
jgi:hypothetical protein